MVELVFKHLGNALSQDQRIEIRDEVENFLHDLHYDKLVKFYNEMVD